MRAAVRRETLAVLRRLRKLAAKSSEANLVLLMGESWYSSPAGKAAYHALNAAGFYDVVRRPAMVRAVTRAIEAVRKSDG